MCVLLPSLCLVDGGEMPAISDPWVLSEGFSVHPPTLY